jgi:hypothetical protein
MTLQAFTLLCALATISCVAGATRRSQFAFIGGGVVAGTVLMLPSALGLPFAPLLAVEPSQVALLLVLFALARLHGDVGVRRGLFLGGMLAVVWLQALVGTGWPWFAAGPFIAAVVAVAAGYGLKQTFFPPQLQDEVALLVLAGGLLLALVPGMLGGWDSAQALQGEVAARAASVNNVVWVAAGFVVLGAVFAWWKTSRRWNR